MTAEQRLRREQVRLRAADRFAEAAGDAQVAREFRVSRIPANRCRRALETGGREALVFKGPGGAGRRLDDAQLARLEQALTEGPMVYGWDDQCWTLARIADVIQHLFKVGYTVAGVCSPLHRLGWSRQAPPAGPPWTQRGTPGFAEAGYAALFDAAHQQLSGALVVVWDNLNTHSSAEMRRLIAAHPWLTVFYLPAYIPELNPVEGVWAHAKKSLANLAMRTIDQLIALVRDRLKRMRYRPALIVGFPAKTGLDFQPP
ncbi:transposase [Thermocatellispora tengchongensis]|uniref:Transposase n=1 Tax=Thermocatellispora tengchongensis TaxID=1073253 RepID=A0A840P944_9ACTN|nr:transposase [Thermocatellispora tengchongensis]MBB5136188.1 transposase [Thermocatellispora tengchongensis]